MTTTTNIKLSTPAHGASVNLWDSDPVNNNSAILDTLFGSVTTKSLTNAPVTLSATEAQVSILRFTGALSGNCAITVSAIRKAWICENNTTGAFVVTITGGSGNVVGLPPGSSTVYWDGTNVSFVNLGKIGEYWDYAGSAVPAWVAACTVPPALSADGSTFSAVTYPQLNAILGGNTLPNSLGRARFSLNGGTGRITTAGSGIDGDTRFSAGGAQNITLDTTMIPAHSHGVTDPGHDHAVSGGIYGGTSSTTGVGAAPNSGPLNAALVDITPAATGISIQNAGGGLAHNNMSPAYIGGITMIWAA